MAPDDIVGVFKQRLRWAMGALQILKVGVAMLCGGVIATAPSHHVCLIRQPHLQAGEPGKLHHATVHPFYVRTLNWLFFCGILHICHHAAA